MRSRSLSTVMRVIDTGEASIFVELTGSGPPLLLLHGFPQSSSMWSELVPVLARRFTVVCADLRGYGRSSCPPSTADHAPYSKRAMARDMVAVMRELGHDRFAIAGHDRGGRAAYRLALDHPACVQRLAVLDIVPSLEAWERADARLALGYWPWSLLAQPEPLPERLIAAAPDAIVDDALTNWDTPARTFAPEIRDAYVEVLRDPAHAHAICEEYRAAATLDRHHDEIDRDRGHRIACPVLALWSARGSLDHWYVDQGGALGIWRAWAERVEGHAVDGGHFFPEEQPQAIAAELARFFGDDQPMF